MAGPTTQFWQERFENNETHWDRGAPNPQLLAWRRFAALPYCRAGLRRRLGSGRTGAARL